MKTKKAITTILVLLLLITFVPLSGVTDDEEKEVELVLIEEKPPSALNLPYEEKKTDFGRLPFRRLTLIILIASNPL